MALPKIDLPISELVLPSTGNKIMYRPFTVKEEKILLIAAETRDPLAEMMAIKQVVNNCLINTDITEISMLDLEYIFLKLRANSINNTAQFVITDPDTQEKIQVDFDIESMEILRDPEHTKEVRVNEDLLIILKYPSIDDFTKIVEMPPQDPMINYIVMVACLDKLATEDEVHDFRDYNDDEISDFMDNMSGDVIKKISKFFDTMPKIRQEVKYTNSNGDDKTFVVEGMRSFFI
jgi:hypothetical protein|tara:strand:- start:2252 stop:2953 length:702 start_codon:yes stop_codon:yes gene_type:complete